jgi:hypothetical protein
MVISWTWPIQFCLPQIGALALASQHISVLACTKIGEGSNRAFVQSGDTFTFTTNDPKNLPLPNLELLEMQWALQRLVGMCGAAEWPSLDEYDDDSIDGDNGWFIPQTLSEVRTGQHSRRGRHTFIQNSNSTSDVPRNVSNSINEHYLVLDGEGCTHLQYHRWCVQKRTKKCKAQANVTNSFPASRHRPKRQYRILLPGVLGTGLTMELKPWKA